MVGWHGAAAQKGKLSNKPAVGHTVVENDRITSIENGARAFQITEEAADKFWSGFGITIFIPDSETVINGLNDVVAANIKIRI